MPRRLKKGREARMDFASEPSPAPTSIRCVVPFCSRKVDAIAFPRMGLRVAVVEKSPFAPTVLILRA